MKAILKAPVDLLFFGGIGTYVRASSESDEAAGDRANDAIRITGADLRCKVIGEGANLGMTQRGRIEAALAGIRLNTDAIDNSAGVNTSDVEVNIKIALSAPVRAGALTLEARNALLAEMTDEVARLVLRNNYQQTLALSLGAAARAGGPRLPAASDADAGERAACSTARSNSCPTTWRSPSAASAICALTRPELAVLLAYAKLTLYSELLDSNVPDDPYLGRELDRYFPKEMTERFPDALHSAPAAARDHRHAARQFDDQPRRRDADRAHRRPDRRARRRRSPPPSPRCATATAWSSSTARSTRSTTRCPARCSSSLYAAVQDLLLDRLVWFLRNVDLDAGAGEDHRALPRRHRAGRSRARQRAVEVGGRGARRAQRRARARPACRRRWRAASPVLPVLKAAPDIVLVADRAEKPVAEVTATYFATEAFFQLDRVAGAVAGIAVSDYFDRLALDRALDSIGDAERRLTAAMVGNGARRRRRGGGMGQAAPGRGRAHPRGDPRDRRLGADAVEAVGGGEPAGRFGAAVITLPE